MKMAEKDGTVLPREEKVCGNPICLFLQGGCKERRDNLLGCPVTGSEAMNSNYFILVRSTRGSVASSEHQEILFHCKYACL